MGTYYSLVNDTEKESLHLDFHIKSGPIRFNKAVHCAFVNYMFEHPGDSFRIVSDTGAYDECDVYKEIDLLSYKFANEEVTKYIVSELNLIYKDERYGVWNGIGFERLLTKRAVNRLWRRLEQVFSKIKLWFAELSRKIGGN